MALVRFDHRARIDLKSIAEYIGVENHSPIAAQRLINEIRSKCEAYARQPLMGTIIDELGDELRVFSYIRNYVVIHSPFDDGIHVLRVFHTARDWGNAFLSGEPRASKRVQLA